MLKSTLPAPIKPNHIPANSQWLAGEGAGSWFSIQVHNFDFMIHRYNPMGITECSGIFSIKNNHPFNINEPFQITYLSHCQTVTVIQNRVTIILQKRL